MGQYLKFKTQDGGEVLVEVVPARVSLEKGIVKAGLGKKVTTVVTEAKESFEAAMEVITSSTQALVQKLEQLAKSPDEVEINFGIKIAAEVGAAVIAKAGADAEFSVKLTWKRGKVG